MNLTEKVKTGFPQEIEFPELLSQLCSWHEHQNFDKKLSGYFELFENDREVISAWVDRAETQKRLAVFGMSPDGGLYCIWLQNNGKKPIVYLGSGQDARVFAKDIQDFIALLAIGYNDICSADMSQPPDEGSLINPKFQAWVDRVLNVNIPVTGRQIVDAAVRESDNIYEWLVANCTW
ncbi:hypothetical protein [Chamaesiphon sp. VAR_69_metabat_338]|uniref:hypothetical protein n=1 Tax=Chamaesiphon sp. VAR_69_metabat_338 TaxID=2964704 RepID=UPI00286E4797|nr:hypothetical protein [Chamaesiphon sp. VAR_69_metabat_338]